MNTKNSLPRFTAVSSLIGSKVNSSSVNEGSYVVNKSDIITQAGCFSYSRCDGVFKRCTTCCIEAATGGSIRIRCSPERSCGLCGIDQGHSNWNL